MFFFIFLVFLLKPDAVNTEVRTLSLFPNHQKLSQPLALQNGLSAIYDANTRFPVM
jgi:hypothetical protein